MGEVLVIANVDDDALTRAIIRLFLERAFAAPDVRVLEGASGEAAIALRFGTPTPALLILARLMPDMAGAEAISEIRRRERTEDLPRVPIILEEAYPDSDVPEADARLFRLFTEKDLIALVEALLTQAPGSRLANRA